MKNHLTKLATSFLNEVQTQLHLDAHMNPTVPVELRLNPRNAWCPRDRLKHSTVNTMGKTAQTLAVTKMSSSITVHLPLVRLQTLSSSSSSLSRLRLD